MLPLARPCRVASCGRLAAAAAITDDERAASVRSAGPELSIAGVAEPGPDIAALVELPVDRGAEHRHLGVLGAQGLEPRGRGHEADEAQPLGPALLEQAQGGGGEDKEGE